MRLTPIGVSGSIPGPASAASSYLLQSPQASVLLDLGSGALGPLQRVLDPARLDAVLLSHLHTDHVADLAALCVYLQYGPTGPHPPVSVVGPVQTRERVEGIHNGAVGEVLRIEASWQEQPHRQIKDLSVQSFPAWHPVPAVAMRWEHAGQVFTYSGDTDLDDSVVAAAAQADLLLVEAAFEAGRDDGVTGVHLTGERAGELAAAAGAKRVLLTHIPPWGNPEQAVRAAKSRYRGPVDLAQPGVAIQV